MNIGDRFLSELLETQPVSGDTFRGERVFTPNPRTVYGGELMAQALVAASKTVDKGLKPHSLHCYFHDRANVKLPNQYCVTRFRDSRSFSHRLVEAFPLVRDIDQRPFFRMDCSFKTPEQDQASFVAAMPKVSSVNHVEDFRSFVEKLNDSKLPEVTRSRINQFLAFDKTYPVEMKFCEPECILGLKTNATGRLHAWMRLKEKPTIDIAPYRDAILTYFSDALLLWVAITEPLPVTYLVTLNQSIWFHNPDVCPEPDEWILFETRANYVGDTLTLSYGAIWDKDGRLLASMAQQGLMRTQALTPVSSQNQLEEQKKSPNTNNVTQ
ncbi:Acyl-coenzyme A thioesterase 8 [Fasciola hepatica]|uniref:Acyl-coenzyme A thioesterase 8 n=1 Tax=Fasciola hepatica TaxID=6192 RepID=A0A4E0R230_FASHE|nr:Acyl-coenzyme A thioesterase 8 [Fasciola hepatica]